ncbi:MAG: DUF1080 domain-containing protein [Planctomycetes bacterium]|nr:DUF1080 domain-containing protein [Planctomycetota bacterium]
MKRLLAGLSAAVVFACLTQAVVSKDKVTTADLSLLADGKGWHVVGRKATALDEAGKKGVKFDKNRAMGIAWMDDFDFTEGVIEVDIKGEDKPQQSFVGIAFRVVDGKTHDAVYFRPFNFKSADAERQSHAVQYVSHAQYPWKKLRQEHTGKYEKAVNPVPDPNGWFHARIVVEKRKISVFVDNAKEPSLVVTELSDRKGGKVGLFVGNDSGGEFANLKITAAK